MLLILTAVQYSLYKRIPIDFSSFPLVNVEMVSVFAITNKAVVLCVRVSLGENPFLNLHWMAQSCSWEWLLFFAHTALNPSRVTFPFSQSDRWEMVSVLFCISLITSEPEHLFICLLAIVFLNFLLGS